MENPGWYTPYTPYQAEIAQGRLESLLNFQTMVTDLTGMEVASASLLDEATAAAEAMALMHRAHTSQTKGDDPNVCLVSDGCFPQTIDVLRSRAEPLGIDLRVVSIDTMTFDASVFGAIVQYPDAGGELRDLRPLIARAHESGTLVSVGADLLSLALIVPPGEMGADVVYGSSQRFGVPMGYGGPHAAFFATRNAFVRQLPGRLIGVSVDAHGHRAYRMALATREQHIRREKATSNICTAQALLANMAAMYAVYHGPKGIAAIAARVHTLARVLEAELAELGIAQLNAHYFDTLRVKVPGGVEPCQASRRRRSHQFQFHRRRHDLDCAQRDPRHGRSPRHRWCLHDRPGQATSRHRLRGGRGLAPVRIAGRVSRGSPPDECVPDASGVQHPSLRDGDDALHPQPRAKGPRARQLHDPARLVHDEAERGDRDAPDHVESVQPHASVRARGPGGRLHPRPAGTRGRALRDHRLRQGLVTAELRSAG